MDGSDSVRVTLVGPAARVDVVLPAGSSLEDALAGGWSEAGVPGALGVPGSAAGTRLVRGCGSVLDPSRTPEEQGIVDGDVVLVVPATGRVRGAHAGRGSAGTRPAAREPGLPVRADAAAVADVPAVVGSSAVGVPAAVAVAGAPAAVAVGGVSMLLLAAVAATALPGSAVGPVVAVLGLLAAIGVMVPGLVSGTARPAAWLDERLPWRPAAPVLAGAAAWLAVGVDPALEAEVLLGVVAAAVAAATVAAAGRLVDADREDRSVALLVWLAAAAGLALVATTVLLAGGAPLVVAVVAVVVPVGLVRLLPTGAVSVPDDQLLELDRLSVTAWSALSGDAERAGAGARRRRFRVRPAGVAALVARAGALVRGGSVASAVVVAGGTVALVASLPAGGWARVAVPVLLWSVGLGLALGSRAQRDPASRLAVLAGGGAALAGATVTTLLVLPSEGRVWAVAALCVAGLGAAAVAVAAGRSWRSLNAARLADALEVLAVVLVIPAGVAAAGGVAWARQLGG